eukprot:5754-Heterococcus_DN1.PRE.2
MNAWRTASRRGSYVGRSRYSNSLTTCFSDTALRAGTVADNTVLAQGSSVCYNCIKRVSGTELAAVVLAAAAAAAA